MAKSKNTRKSKISKKAKLRILLFFIIFGGIIGSLSYSFFSNVNKIVSIKKEKQVLNDRIEELTDEKIDNMIDEYKSEKPAEPTEEKWKCAFLEWSGTRKHPKATEVIEEGIIKGNWFYRKDGSKKKTTANGFKFIERME